MQHDNEQKHTTNTTKDQVKDYRLAKSVARP